MVPFIRNTKLSLEDQRRQLDLMRSLNEEHLAELVRCQAAEAAAMAAEASGGGCWDGR
jgi:hypothetical protein